MKRLLKSAIAALITTTIPSTAKDAAVSMHMNLHHTTSGDIQVSEVRVPTGGIWRDTYYETIGIRSNEALNVGHGYAGMQESSDSHGNRVHIFSLWDERAVNYIPHLGYGMDTETFGGEGNGSKTWCRTSDQNHPLYWQPDVWYTHVVRAWDVGSHTHYGFFVRDGVSGTWRHLSTIGMPHADIRINSGAKNDAFLENWTAHTHNGSYRREMHLRNSMRRDLSGSWQTAQKAWYSVNSGDFSTRSSNWPYAWDGGKKSDASGEFYYMVTGGTETRPTAPLSYDNSVFGTWLEIANEKSADHYAALTINSLQSSDLGGGQMAISWDRDSTTLPQLSYTIALYDNASLSGAPLLTDGYDYSDVKLYNAPNASADTIDVSGLDLSKRYYLALTVTDIFDNETTQSIELGSGVMVEYLSLTSPSGGSYSIGDRLPIGWSSNLESGFVELNLLDGSDEVVSIGEVAVSANGFQWDVPNGLSAGTNYRVTLAGVQADSLADTSASFSITVPDSAYLLLPRGAYSLHSVSSEQDNNAHAAANAIDGDPTTFWHTAWGTNETTPPHEIVFALNQITTLSGLRYLPRQDGANGRIEEFEIFLSLNGEQWQRVIAQGLFFNNADEQEVQFSSYPAKYLKLVALSEVNGNPWTAAAEINLLYNAKGNVATVEAVAHKSAALIGAISERVATLTLEKGVSYEAALVQLNGRTVQSQRIVGAGQMSLKLGAHAQGVYLLRLRGGGVEEIVPVRL